MNGIHYFKSQIELKCKAYVIIVLQLKSYHFKK